MNAELLTVVSAAKERITEQPPHSGRTSYMLPPTTQRNGDHMNTEIKQVTDNKRQYLPLLLLADEQEDMIDRYLDRGAMYVLRDRPGHVIAECVVTDEGGGVLEIQNLAVLPEYQRRGCGKMLVQFLETHDRGGYSVLRVGTSPGHVPFYEACGFRQHHIEPGYFTAHYGHPIYEDGVQLTDRICLQKRIGP